MPKGDKLTAKQQAFFDAYVKTRSAGAAYRAAYQPAKMTDPMCSTEGVRLLAHPVISLMVRAFEGELAAAQKAATEKTAAELGITRERHLRHLSRIAYGTLKGMAAFDKEGTVTFTASDKLSEDQWAMIAGIEKVVSPKGAESTKLKTPNQLAAADQIAKVMGWYGTDAQGPAAGSNVPMNLNIHIEPPAKK